MQAAFVIHGQVIDLAKAVLRSETGRSLDRTG